MTTDLALTAVTRAGDRLRPHARHHPLDDGVPPSGRHRNSWRIDATRSAVAFVAVERYGCGGGTPVWHVSVSIWSTFTHTQLDDEPAARRVAEALLADAGTATSLWSWRADARVGHLRSHMTEAEADGVPPSTTWPEGHDEHGEWYEREGAA